VFEHNVLKEYLDLKQQEIGGNYAIRRSRVLLFRKYLRDIKSIRII